PAYSGPGTCAVTGAVGSQSLNCSFGDLAPQASVSVHVTSTTTFNSCQQYNNTATAAATNESSPVQASASTTVQCPNLSITKVADKSSVSAGQQIGFTITVHNAGPGVAKSVTLNDPLPTGAGISWSMSPANAACNIASSTLSCNFGDMASG